MAVKTACREILIIDDNRESRELLKNILDDSYPVRTARGAKEGLKMLSGEVGLVLLDYVLPDLSGLEVLSRIKKAYPSVPVIFITGYGNEEVCQQAFRAGARDYIKKPFQKDEICSKVAVLTKMQGNRESRSNTFLLSGNGHSACFEDRRVPHRILDSILKVKDYLDEHYTKKLGLTEAAKMAGMSKPSFCSYFKHVTGYSLIDYSNYVRVERAKDLLRNMDLSITQVATASGYNSVNYFIETFKRFHGFSPAEFRKNLKPQ